MKPRAFNWGRQPVQAKQPKMMQSLILLRTDFIAQHLHAILATSWRASHVALAKSGADGHHGRAWALTLVLHQKLAPAQITGATKCHVTCTQLYKKPINHAKLLSSSWNFTHQVFVMTGCETMDRKQP